jgi:cold shock CspA family protein
MVVGVLTWFNATEGYGFVKPDDESGPLLVTLEELQGLSGAPKVGDHVAIDLRSHKHRRSTGAERAR